MAAGLSELEDGIIGERTVRIGIDNVFPGAIVSLEAGDVNLLKRGIVHQRTGLDSTPVSRELGRVSRLNGEADNPRMRELGGIGEDHFLQRDFNLALGEQCSRK